MRVTEQWKTLCMFVIGIGNDIALYNYCHTIPNKEDNNKWYIYLVKQQPIN